MSKLPLLAGACALLLAAGCSSDLPVQPTPTDIRDYFDEIKDEPVPLTEFVDECSGFFEKTIFLDQVYYEFDPIRNAIPKSLVQRGTNGDVSDGEIIEVILSCERDIAVMQIQVPGTYNGASYEYDDFYGIMNLSASEAQAIRDALIGFVPKRR